MDSKKLIVFGIWGVIAAGCGDNDCQQAAERIKAKSDMCGITYDEGTYGADCTDARAKKSQHDANCFEAASCEALKGTDPQGTAAFAACIGK